MPAEQPSPNGKATYPGIWGSLGVKRRAARARRRPSKTAAVDIWRALDDRIDPAKFRPKLAADLEIKHFKARTGDYVMVCNPREMAHFRFEPGDAELIELLDGERTIEEIVLDRLEESGEIELSGVADLVLTLYEANLLDVPYVDVDAALA
ncbi:MAG TPA: hypothetical protein VJ818_03730, partial [Actinomycetota bacterium]|nr:hypothetical protein [Actinomycetota bacterium]